MRRSNQKVYTWQSRYELAGNVIKWCRQNGERGRDWDFVGGLKVELWFYESKLETAYLLQWEWPRENG
jgi:hypothetical protein